MTKLITLAIALAAAITLDVARGDDLNWQIMGPASSKVSDTGAQLNWNIMGLPACKCDATGVCTCGEDCDCETLQAKPIAYAYKFAGKCAPCDQLKQHESELPVDLIWKRAPSWVKSAPTIHWQGHDGKWYQFRVGVAGDHEDFIESWKRTTRHPVNASQHPAKMLTGSS